ncbi:MAG: DoxX family protein [Planctomycetota bacterium]|nr:DoxX family protein [Planctomycetota bacterium]
MTEALQLIIGLGLLNVWLLRSRSPTSYRGRDSQNLKQEFSAYGLPTFVFYVVGTLKIGSAAALIAGFWIPELVLPAASVIAVLMVGALALHIKVRDALMKSVPAILMLAMSLSLTLLNVN